MLDTQQGQPAYKRHTQALCKVHNGSQAISSNMWQPS